MLVLVDINVLILHTGEYITVEAECGAAKKATCFNQMCAKVNGTDTCQCPPGYELGSNGTSCNGKLLLE